VAEWRLHDLLEQIRTAETPAVSTVHHPLGKPGGPGLFHVKGLQLPAYIQNVAHAFRRKGLSESEAIQRAIGVVKDWAAGRAPGGGKVHADVQAAAAKAVAEWEAAKAAAHGRNAGMGSEYRAAKAPYGDVPYGDPGYLDADGNQVSKSGKPGVKRYPLSADKVMAAWTYINQAKNAGQYTAGQLSAIKGRIRSAMKQHGHQVADDGRSAGRPDVERRFTMSAVAPMWAGGEENRDGVPKRIGGYAAKFNTYSRDLGHFVEEVEPTFFNKSRGDGWPDVICRFNHEDAQLLGTVAGRTLELGCDRDGLLYDVEPPTTMRYIVELVQRGDVQKSSFAFRCIEDEWTMTSDGGPLRRLHTGQLVDVAPVVTPAYADTSAGLRSLADHVGADPEEVRSLAEAHELRRFFVRTDRPSQVRKPLSPAVAMKQLLERRADPFDEL
jgi:HK97 family phage prohead protease